ncbi:hypothetical protein ACWDNT_24525, partial [Streptomyces sp. NPDC000963]
MALFKKRTAGKPGEWYYCLEHKKVEEGPECPSKNRFGPYTTREESSGGGGRGQPQHGLAVHREHLQLVGHGDFQEPAP